MKYIRRKNGKPCVPIYRLDGVLLGWLDKDIAYSVMTFQTMRKYEPFDAGLVAKSMPLENARIDIHFIKSLTIGTVDIESQWVILLECPEFILSEWFEGYAEAKKLKPKQGG